MKKLDPLHQTAKRWDSDDTMSTDDDVSEDDGEDEGGSKAKDSQNESAPSHNTPDGEGGSKESDAKTATSQSEGNSTDATK